MQNISVTTTAHPQNKNITLLSVKGSLDTNTAPEFEKAFQSALGENKFNLIIDLKEAYYVSSAGWGIFVGEIKRIRSQKGDLLLSGMCPEVMEAYELLQFSTILKAFPTVEQAVKDGFGNSKSKKDFEKTKVDKGFEKSGKEKISGKLPAEKGVQKPGLAISFAEPDPSGNPKKPGFFGRILKPWKWF
jgi:anti-sigma B factor antagonist